MSKDVLIKELISSLSEAVRDAVDSIYNDISDDLYASCIKEFMTGDMLDCGFMLWFSSDGVHIDADISGVDKVGRIIPYSEILDDLIGAHAMCREIVEGYDLAVVIADELDAMSKKIREELAKIDRSSLESEES